MQRKNDWNKPEWIAVISTFFMGLAVHMFGLVNLLHNYDDVTIQPGGYGTGLSSGRWFLTIVGDFFNKHFGGYNLPWVNGVLFVALVAVTVGFVVSVFSIKNWKYAALIGAIFISFPTATSTLLFRYTAVYDAVALLFAVFAVWILEHCKYGFGISAVCIALSLGIYQAYIPLTISIFVLLLIKQVLQENVEFWYVVKRGCYYCLAIIAGLFLYNLLLRICLHIYDTSLSGYQGINTMGKLNLSELPLLLKETYRTFLDFPISGYATLVQMEVLKHAYLALDGVMLLTILVAAILNKKKLSQIVLLVLLCAVFPIAVNFIMVMCPESWIYALMVYSFAIVPCLPLVIIETLPQIEGFWGKVKRALVSVALIVVALIVACNAYMANVNYTSLHYANRQTENYMNALVTQIRMTEEFDTEKRWAVLGDINDPLSENSWKYVKTYGGNSNGVELQRAYSWKSWINLYFGYMPAWASEDEITQLNSNPDVINMKTWPNEGSIKVIDDYVVIKFQNIQ